MPNHLARRWSTALAAGLFLCALSNCDNAAPPPGEIAGVPAPRPEDPVADWELQYLPIIDGHMQAGRLDSVIHVCQQGLQEDSTRIVLYNLMASAYASQERYEAATEALKTAVRLSPAFTAAWVNLGGIHTRQGRWEEALPFLEEAARLDADSPAAHRRLGEIYLRTGHAEQAAEQFREAMKIMPDDATLHFLLGQALEKLARPDEALAAFVQSGALDPGFVDAHTRAATLARAQGRPQLADSLMKENARLQELGDGSDEAIETRTQLRRALANAPEEAIHHARLGGFYLWHGYLPEALALFDRAAVLEPDNVWLFNQFGGLLSQGGHGPEALRFYQKALQVQPDLAPALINAGGILNAMGRPEEALSYLERAQAQAPDDPSVRFYVGVTYMSLNQLDTARRILNEAHDLAGDNEALRQQIESALDALPNDEQP